MRAAHDTPACRADEDAAGRPSISGDGHILRGLEIPYMIGPVPRPVRQVLALAVCAALLGASALPRAHAHESDDHGRSRVLVHRHFTADVPGAEHTMAGSDGPIWLDDDVAIVATRIVLSPPADIAQVCAAPDRLTVVAKVRRGAPPVRAGPPPAPSGLRAPPDFSA